MGGPNEPPSGDMGSDGQKPEWETTEFPSIPGYGYPGNDGSQDFGQPSYGYGTPPSVANPSPSSDADPQQTYPGQQNYTGPPTYASQPDYPGQQNYPSQQGYPGEQGYPGQAPPPGQWPPQSPGWQGQPTPPNRNRRTALIASVAVVLAAGVGVGIYFAASGSSDGSNQADKTSSITAPPTTDPSGSTPSESTPTQSTPTQSTPTQSTPSDSTPVSPPALKGGKVVVPTSFDGYTRLNNTASQAAKSAISREAAGPGGTLLKSATVEVYGPTRSQLPSLITITLPTSAVLGAESSSRFVTSFLQGAMVVPKTAATNTHGGSASCGVPAGSGSDPADSVCAWSDSSTSGAIVSTEPALATGKLAAVQDAFRGELG